MSAFTPRPFAFMRMTHEALRAGFATLATAAEAGELDTVRDEYARLRRVIEVHAAQEERAFFPLLDRLFDGAVAKAGLRDAHAREEAHQQAFEAALAGDDAAAVRQALSAWSGSFETHLVDEETVMMPLTQKVAPTLEGRAAAVGDILAVDWQALKDDHLPYVTASLAANKPYGPTRMFVSALQIAAGDRYAELAPIVAASVPAAVGDQLRVHGHLPAA